MLTIFAFGVGLVLAAAQDVEADPPVCHKLQLDTEASVGLSDLNDESLTGYFNCDGSAAEAADEDGQSWFASRLPTDRLAGYRLGSFNYNGFQGGFDTWLHVDGGTGDAMRVIHDAYPDNDPFRLDYGYTGCFGPMAEMCIRALREFRAFHGDGRGADGDRHHVDLKFKLEHNEAQAGVSFWDVAAGFFSGLGGSAREALTGWVGKPRSYCRGLAEGERQTAVDMVRTGSMAYAHMRELSRRVWAAERAAMAAAAAVGWTYPEPVLAWPQATASAAPVEIEFSVRQGAVTAVAYEVEWTTAADGTRTIKRKKLAEHIFSAPLVWVAEALRDRPIRRVKVEAKCRETRPKLDIREFTATWTYNVNIDAADPWLKTLPFLDPGHDLGAAELSGTSDIVVLVQADHASWRRLVTWDRLFGIHLTHELAAIAAAFPPEARDDLSLQRKFGWRSAHAEFLVVLRRVEFDVDKLMGQGLHRESVALRQILTNPKALAAKVLIESNPLRKLLLCSPGPIGRMRNPSPFRYDVRSEIDELCELAHELALESSPPAAPLDFLKWEGFVAMAMPAWHGKTRILRVQLPNTFSADSPAKNIFAAIGEAPAGQRTGKDLAPERVGGVKPELNLAALSNPGAVVVQSPFQRQLLRQVNLGSEIKTTGVHLAFAGEGGRRMEMVLGQWLIPKDTPLPAWPERLNTDVDDWVGMPVAAEAAGNRFYGNEAQDKWAAVAVGVLHDGRAPFQALTVIEICRDACAS